MQEPATRFDPTPSEGSRPNFRTLFDPRTGKPVTVTVPDKSIAPVPPKAEGYVNFIRRPDELVLQGYASVLLNIAFDLVLELAVRARRQGAHHRVDARGGSRLEEPSLKLH